MSHPRPASEVVARSLPVKFQLQMSRWRAAVDAYVPPAAETGGRLVSLDVARGMAVAMMLFVEQLRGSGFPSLRHAAWVGLTWADIVFPCFMFLAGCSLAVVTLRVPETGNLIAMFVRRALNLFAVGLVFNAFSGGGADLSTLRIPGVLQRIGVCLLAALLVVLLCRRLPVGRSESARSGLASSQPGRSVSGGSVFWVGLVALVLLVAYGQWLVTSGLGCGSPVTARCNAAGALDRRLLPVAHLYRGADFPGYDPEGVASSVAAVVTVLAGWVAMRCALARQASVRWWLLALPAAAALWAASWVGPLTAGIGSIKRLWSPVFTLRTAAIALVVLALCRPLDGLQRRAAAVGHRAVCPLAALGRHALTIYVGQHLIGTALDRTTIDGRSLADRMAGHFAGFGSEGRYLAFAIACTIVATAAALTLDALDRTAKRRRQPSGRQPGLG